MCKETDNVEKTTDQPLQLSALLSTVICKAFDNEEDFIARFYPEYKPDRVTLDEFYMASERCRVVIKCKLIGTYQLAVPTIKTADFLEWCEGR